MSDVFARGFGEKVIWSDRIVFIIETKCSGS